MIIYSIRKNPKNPVLITVPHSGSFYPELFKKYIKLDLDKIRKIEDYQSDKILKFIKKENVDFLIAKCSRAVVDLNRSRKSIDNDMFNGVAIIGQPDEKKMLSYGLGVFPRFISNKSIFKTKLPLSYSKKILKFCKNKPISFEVFADDQKSMIEQGKKINTWGKNIYVKVPVVNSKNKFTGNVIKELNNKNIKLNITAVYTAKQTAKILKAINKKTKVIISIFAGRAGDTGKDPIPEFVKSIKLAKNYKNVEILWASVREPYNYLQAKQLGCHIITIPPAVIEKIEKFGKSFNQLTIETVKAFLVDSKKSNFKI